MDYLQFSFVNYFVSDFIMQILFFPDLTVQRLLSVISPYKLCFFLTKNLAIFG